MEKNYMFQNYGYVDKPVNFKHVVIDLLRRYGLFIHMRDEPSGIYDLDKFLYEKNPMGIPYHKEKIEKLKNRIEDAKNKLQQLNTDAETLYQEWYNAGLEKYNELIETNKYFTKYKAVANNYKKRISDIQDFINNFKLENQEFDDIIKENLVGCVEALSEDYDFYIKEAVENDVGDNPEPYCPVHMDKWIADQTKDCLNEIEWCTKQIKEEEQAIKNLQEKDKLIKEIFIALEPFDKEIE